MRLFFLEVLW